MSTRCTINFCYQSKDHINAKIYRHCDGYPEGVLPDLEEFFKAVVADTTDTRFGDPNYLAAKFVVWQAAQNAKHYDSSTGEYVASKPLDFISLGICMKDPGDIEHTYFVVCSGRGSQPEVLHEIPKHEDE
jgi:hypothetical protein